MTKLKQSYLYKYYKLMDKGKIKVGKWIYKIFDILVKGIEDGTYIYDDEKANKSVKFIETFIHHSKGRHDVLTLELWQKAIVCAIFGIVNKDGKRQFREVVLIVSRKNGKSLFASAIMSCMAFIDKEYGAEIYCLAPKLEQANIVFDNFYQTISKEYELLSLCKKRRTDIYIDVSNTVIKPLAFSDKKSDGLNPHCVVCDEIAAWSGQNGLRMYEVMKSALGSRTIKPLAFSDKKSDGLNPHCVVCDEIAAWSGQNGLRMYEVMKSALGSRTQPLILNISTAGYVNDSIYDELMLRSTSFLNGSSEETQLLPFLYMIDDIDLWDCMDELEKSNPNLGVSVTREYLQEEIRIAKGSLSKRAEFITKYCNIKQNSSQAEKSNPNLGVSVTREYLQEEIRIAKGSLSKRAEFITKYCNIKQNSSQAWLTYEQVEKSGIKEFTLNDFKGSYCVGGIDLSQTTDLTCASIVIERDSEEYVFSQFFMPKNKINELIELDKVPYDIYARQGFLKLSGENYVDYKDVKAWFDMLRYDYQIYATRIGYDRYSAQYLVDDMANKGYRMDDVIQGWNLSPIIREFEGKLKDATRIGYDRYSAQYLVDDMANKGYRMDDVIQGWNLSPIIREFEGKLKDGKIHVGKNNLLKSHLLNVALKYETDNQKFKPVKMKASDHIDGFVSIIDALTVKSKYYNEIKFIIQNRKG